MGDQAFDRSSPVKIAQWPNAAGTELGFGCLYRTKGGYYMEWRDCSAHLPSPKAEYKYDIGYDDVRPFQNLTKARFEILSRYEWDLFRETTG